MEDYSKLKKSADKVATENKAQWKANEKEIKDALKRCNEIRDHLKKALQTHIDNAKMAHAEYGGWTKLADDIIAQQTKLADAKKNKDKAAQTGIEKELKKLEKPATAYEANISAGVGTANDYMNEVRKVITALDDITLS